MPGSGLMSYHCTLPQGHEIETSDPADQQPCYAVESDRSARLWRAWAGREFGRKVTFPTADADLITCPICHEHSMRVSESVGTCENPECGVEAEIQPDLSQVTQIGEPLLDGDGDVARQAPADPGRDADIRAAAQRIAPQHLADGCLGEHEPVTNLHCEKRPAPPEGTMLVDPGPQPLEPEQVPSWVRVAEGSPQPTHEQVQMMRERRDEIAVDATDVEWVAFFDRDAIGIGPASLDPSEGGTKVQNAHGRWVNRNNFESAQRQMEESLLTTPTKQREGDLSNVDLTIDMKSGEMTEHHREPTKQREGDQILPKAGVECVQDIVIDAMIESKRVGTERYGQPLMTFNGRKGMQDIVEEARDFFVYGTMLLREAEADRNTLVVAVANAVQAAHCPEGRNLPVGDVLPFTIAETAVDTIMGWVTAQRGEQSLRPGLSLSLTERLDKVEEVLRPQGVINRAIAMAVDSLYVDRDVDNEPKGGVGRISAARQHQIDKGYTPEHDAQHDLGDLLDAAKSLIDDDPDQWPWDGSSYPGRHDLSPEDRLAKAGAMIAAAIDAGASAPEPPPLAPSKVFDILSLVEGEFPATLADLPIQTWSAQTRVKVIEWAGAVHFAASDNDVTIPDLPEVLR